MTKPLFDDEAQIHRLAEIALKARPFSLRKRTLAGRLTVEQLLPWTAFIGGIGLGMLIVMIWALFYPINVFR